MMDKRIRKYTMNSRNVRKIGAQTQRENYEENKDESALIDNFLEFENDVNS